MKKLIIKTAVQTLLGTVIVFGYAIGIFAFVAPKHMANFYDLIENEQMSAVYHERTYKKNPTDGNLYRVFSKYIVIKNDVKTIEYGEKFFSLANYDDLITELNSQIYANEFSNPWLGLVCNEDDRLRCGLIGAHIRRGNMERAIELYNEIVKANPIPATDLFRPSYAIFEFGNNADMQLRQDFEDYYARFSALNPTNPAGAAFVQYGWIRYEGFFNV